MPSYQYRKSHCGNKTILRPSYLHNGISYTGKTTCLYWIGAQIISIYSKILKLPRQRTYLCLCSGYGSLHLIALWISTKPILVNFSRKRLHHDIITSRIFSMLLALLCGTCVANRWVPLAEGQQYGFLMMFLLSFRAKLVNNWSSSWRFEMS